MLKTFIFNQNWEREEKYFPKNGRRQISENLTFRIYFSQEAKLVGGIEFNILTYFHYKYVNFKRIYIVNTSRNFIEMRNLD